MKKTILILAMIFAVGFTVESCKKENKEEVKTEETASNDKIYQCPMDCEHGKSYTEEGKCPVCKMDLKAKKAGETDAKVCTKCGKDKAECTCPKHEKDSTNHDGHNH